MTTNFMLLNKLTVKKVTCIFCYHVLILVTAVNSWYVLANFIAIVANAISANQH